LPEHGFSFGKSLLRTSTFASMSLHSRSLTVESIVLSTCELLRRSQAALHRLADLCRNAASCAED
jgi:hypothetical protein